MNFSAWSIRNPVPAILLFVVLTILGLRSLQHLGKQTFPDIEVPVITVSATLEGAAPAQLETEVARKLEDKIATISGIEHITSKITDGSVSISIEFTIDTNTEEALNLIKNAVDSARSDLPSAMTSPIVSKTTTSGGAILTYVVNAPNMDESELSWFVDNNITKSMLAVPGVGKVTRTGGVDREVQVNLNTTLMAALGVNVSDVSSQLKKVQQDASGGRGDIGNSVQAVRTLGAMHSADEVRNLDIPLNNGNHIKLNQVATVVDTIAERSTYATYDGKPVIRFEITRSKGTSEVTVAKAVRETLTTFKTQYPQVKIEEAFNSVKTVEDNYKGSMELLYEGAILAIIVVWWFLRDWRATAVAALALPLSMIPTFVFMQYFGFSLNILTLLAMALVVGILVDDAIVEIENIVRHLRMGKTPYQTAMEAADEIGFAVIATTFTLVAIFLPTAFMGGIPGKFFKQFGITAATAVLMSLLVARLLTPMMAAYLLKASTEEERDSALMTRYLGWVRACLNNPQRTMLAAGCFLLLSLAMALALKTAFMPAQDKAQTKVTLELAPGSTIQDTRVITEQAEKLLRTLPTVTSVFSAVGTGSSNGGSAGGNDTAGKVRKATLTVDLVSRSDRDQKQSAVEDDMRQVLRDLPGARVAVGNGGNGEKLDITLAGSDSGTLESTAAALESQLRTLKGIGNVSSSAALQQPEVQFVPDSGRASALGVTAADVADAIRIGTYGDYSSSLPKLNLPERQIALRVRIDPSQRASIEDIGQLRVTGSNGKIAIASLGDLKMGSGPAQIDRLDRERNITLSVELNGRTLGEVDKEAKQLSAFKQLPAGVHTIEQGELQHMSELFQSFGLSMAIGIFCVYAVLVLLFHDFMQPATILCALPLSLGGALFSLLVTHMSFSMPSVIGLLMLMGIVTKNSILLVEYAIVARQQRGMDRLAALMDACHKRARPILMTTIAMGAGMLPNALGVE